MANASAKRGGDRVVESRHLVGLFLGVVLLCGVFFTLGYVMGHTQPGAVRASVAPERETTATPSSGRSQTQATPAESDSPEWDFYPPKKAEEKPPAPAVIPTKASQPLVPAAAQKSAPAPIKSARRLAPPRIPRGAFLLQLAALKSESDALALTDALQQKRFPAFVVTPSSDKLYHVQVGPYADRQSADVAKRSLERAGFKAIVKH